MYPLTRILAPYTVIIPLYILFLLAFFYFYFTYFRLGVVKKRFFRALKEILQAGENITSQEKQLGLIYKKGSSGV